MSWHFPCVCLTSSKQIHPGHSLKEVTEMTRKQAEERAAQLGLSVWQTETIKVGPTSEAVEIMCVGFADLELAMAEAESWDEALEEATRIIYSA
jgi:hypothetical protein